MKQRPRHTKAYLSPNLLTSRNPSMHIDDIASTFSKIKWCFYAFVHMKWILLSRVNYVCNKFAPSIQHLRRVNIEQESECLYFIECTYEYMYILFVRHYREYWIFNLCVVLTTIRNAMREIAWYFEQWCLNNFSCIIECNLLIL